jgi:uncharacterized membrane protein HdeD (DUF308 family)
MAAVEVAEKEAASLWWLVLLRGIAALILGIFLLSSPGMTTVVLVTFVGAFWLVDGIFSLVGMFIDRSAWGLKLALGILGILAGIYVLRHPLWASILVVYFVVILLGIQGLIMGILHLINGFRGEGWGAVLLGVLYVIFGLVLLANVWVAALSLPIVLGILGIIGGIILIVVSFRVRSMAPQEAAA